MNNCFKVTLDREEDVMTEKYTQDELKEAYFIQLVYTFQAAAMQQMGKIVNPITNEVEKNMEQAKHSIDMLAMLEAKTSGNLTEREHKLLEKTLFELRMNYVDEMKITEEEIPAAGETEQKAEGSQAASPTEEKKEPEQPTGGEEPSGGCSSEKEPSE
jgi:hypothetical protein